MYHLGPLDAVGREESEILELGFFLMGIYFLFICTING